MTQRETIQLLMKALGETIPERGCRHETKAEYYGCNRCQALLAGNIALDNPSSPQYYTHVFGAQDYEIMPCCVIGCPDNATFIACTSDSIFYYCEEHGRKRNMERGIPLDGNSKTYDEYSKSRNRVLGDKS